jgi:glycerophosphoryl diester phosphodiesterase
MASYPMTVSARVFVDVPVLCGHRGSGRGPGENTLPSFQAAVAAGLSWVEVDARVTADGDLVAAHEPILPDGRFIAQLPAAATGLMRVADLLEELPPGIGVDVDLKTSLEDAERPRNLTTAALVADLAAAHSSRRPLLVTSFDPAALLIVRERAPSLPLGLLTWIRFPLRKAIPAAVHLGVQVIAPHVESFGLRQEAPHPGERSVADAVAVAHAAGLQVVAWCPLPAERDVLLEAGVDCLVIDDVL